MVIPFPAKYKDLIPCLHSGKQAAQRFALQAGPLTYKQYRNRIAEAERIYLLGLEQMDDEFGWRINQLLIRQVSYVACIQYSMTPYKLLGLVRQFIGSAFLGSLWARSKEAARIRGDEMGITTETLDNLSISYLIKK